MKIHCILCAAAIAFPQLAQAELPFTTQSLGTVDATVDFCVRAHPAAAMKYQQQARLMVREVSEEGVDKVRNSDEYKAAYTQASAALRELHKQDAEQACNGKPAWDFKNQASGRAGRIAENEGTHDERTN